MGAISQKFVRVRNIVGLSLCGGLIAVGLASCSCSSPGVQTVKTQVKTGVNYQVSSGQSAAIQDEVTEAVNQSPDVLFPDETVDESSVTYTLSDCNADGTPEVLVFAQSTDSDETLFTVLMREIVAEGSSVYSTISQPVSLSELSELSAASSPQDVVVYADASGNTYLSENTESGSAKLHQISLDSRELVSADEIEGDSLDGAVQVTQSPKSESDVISQISEHVTEGEASETQSVQMAYQHFLDEFKGHANQGALHDSVFTWNFTDEEFVGFYNDSYSYALADLNEDAIPELLVRYGVDHTFSADSIQATQFVYVVSYDTESKEAFIANQCVRFSNMFSSKHSFDFYASDHLFSRGMYCQEIKKGGTGGYYLNNALVYLDKRDLKQSALMQANYYPSILVDYSARDVPDVINPLKDDLQNMSWHDLDNPLDNTRLRVTPITNMSAFENDVASYSYNQDPKNTFFGSEVTIQQEPIGAAVSDKESEALVQLAEDAGLYITSGSISQKQIEYTYYNYGQRPDEQRTTDAFTMSLDGPLEVMCQVGNGTNHENRTTDKLRLLQSDQGEVSPFIKPTLEAYVDKHILVGVNVFMQNHYDLSDTAPVTQYVMYLGGGDAS